MSAFLALVLGEVLFWAALLSWVVVLPTLTTGGHLLISATASYGSALLRQIGLIVLAAGGLIFLPLYAASLWPLPYAGERSAAYAFGAVLGASLSYWLDTKVSCFFLRRQRT